jgi:hypothetical protein
VTDQVTRRGQLKSGLQGSVAEWSIAPVLKTGNPQGFVSSNLTASASWQFPTPRASNLPPAQAESAQAAIELIASSSSATALHIAVHNRLVCWSAANRPKVSLKISLQINCLVEVFHWR